ncbi:MAG: glycosyltransferase [Proteobacteria bacterium]|nr:glycosyltransferase [Pseudomonadota bacterium]
MPGSGRIIYHLTRASGPSGGIKVMLDHVEVLRAAGFDAFAYVKNQAQRPTAFDITVPVLTGAFGIRPDDIIIRPETFSARDLEAAAKGGLRQAVFVQNHYYCRHSLGSARCYGDLGVIDVFCASQRIKRFLEENGIAQDVTVVPCAIATAPPSAADKREQIAAMPRKRAFEHGVIKHFFALRHPEFADLPWIEIEDVPHHEALRIMAESTIFLSLQRFEGFGLPALEAMAAGCLVVGFAGDGGWEYADQANGIWIPEDDLEAAADGLAAAVTGSRCQTSESSARIEAGKTTAAGYGPEPRRAALIALFERLQSSR